MRKVKFVFIHHGETKWNKEGKFQGQLDSPLTEKGREQIKEAAEKLRDISFDSIITSDLGRALQSTEIIKNILGIDKIEKDKKVRERRMGVLQDKRIEEVRRLFPHLFNQEGKINFEKEIPQAETLEDFLKRVESFLEDLKLRSGEKNIIVVTHEGVIQAVVSLVSEISFKEVSHLHFKPQEPVFFSSGAIA